MTETEAAMTLEEQFWAEVKRVEEEETREAAQLQEMMDIARELGHE